MARTFADLMNEARQHEICRGIAPNELETLTWRAVVDVCSENDLSFMIGEGRIQTEANYRTGTVAVTAAGTTVTLSGGTWDNTWTNRRVRISGRTEFYEIASIAYPNLTLASAWQGNTASGLSYEMYRDIYTLPSDCDYAKELLLWDATNGREIPFVDYPVFREYKRDQLASTGEPEMVTRLGVSAAGLVQIEFGPLAPSSARTFLIDYYRKPTKPTAYNQTLSPAWPEQFIDVIPLRVAWEYAKRRAHPRRLEAERAYKSRIFQMNAQYDGGNEVLRRVRPTGARAGYHGVRVGARWTGA
jgi:hypothetical protein